jgi:hypothetical protein
VTKRTESVEAISLTHGMSILGVGVITSIARGSVNTHLIVLDTNHPRLAPKRAVYRHTDRVSVWIKEGK